MSLSVRNPIISGGRSEFYACMALQRLALKEKNASTKNKDIP